MIITIYMEGRMTADSIIKFGCNVNIKVIHDDDVFVWNGSFIIWLRPKV